MSTRKIKDAKDLESNELIYFKGHAKATFMSDGRTVEDTINQAAADVNEDLNAKQDKVLKFTNLSASSWVSDYTYNDYPYRCDLTCNGVTSDMYAEVVFSVMQASGGDYAPICETKTNAVSIWSKQNVTISVPTIIITK